MHRFKHRTLNIHSTINSRYACATGKPECGASGYSQRCTVAYQNRLVNADLFFITGTDGGIDQNITGIRIRPLLSSDTVDRFTIDIKTDNSNVIS